MNENVVNIQFREYNRGGRGGDVYLCDDTNIPFRLYSGSEGPNGHSGWQLIPINLAPKIVGIPPYGKTVTFKKYENMGPADYYSSEKIPEFRLENIYFRWKLIPSEDAPPPPLLVPGGARPKVTGRKCSQTLKTGPKGGKYYMKNGKKVYCTKGK